MKNWHPLVVATVLISLIAPSAQALDFSLPMGQVGSRKTRVLYRGSFQGTENYAGRSEETSLHQQGLGVVIPVAKTAKDTWTVSLRGQRFALSGVAPLPNGVRIPDRLYNLGVGAGYTHQIKPGRFWGMNADYGSASDHPFASGQVNTMGGTAMYGWSESAQKHWTLILNYSNNRPFLNNIPLPGFAYTYIASPDFRITAGAPFALLHWKFAPLWSVDFFTIVPWTVRTAIGYQVAKFYQVYGAGEFDQQMFLRRDRAVRKERLFYDEKKLSLGFKGPLTRDLGFDFNAGYAFARSFFEAEQYRDRRQSPRTRLNASWFAGLSVSMSFGE